MIQGSRPREVKIYVPLVESDDWGELKGEWLWAERVNERSFRLNSIPCFKYGLAYGDVVRALERDSDVIFDEVETRGEHSTYRIALAEGVTVDREAFTSAWRPLQQLGCRFEGSKSWLGMDVPPAADIEEVFARLVQGQEQGVWTFEQSHCGHPVDPRETWQRRKLE